MQGDVDQIDFHTKVLGGERSQKRVGVAASDIASFGNDVSIRLWCQGTRYPRARTFAIRKYGQEAAWQLVDEVARRGNWFYNRWVQSGSIAPFCFDEAVASYTESEEFVEWLRWLAAESAAYTEAMKIRRIIPLNLPRRIAQRSA